MKTSVGENIHFGRVVIWSDVNQMIIHFLNHPFRQVAIILFILFFKSAWCKIASVIVNILYKGGKGYCEHSVHRREKVVVNILFTGGRRLL